MSEKSLSIVQEFASALDREDYETARNLIATKCIYEIGDDTLLGPDAIVGSYQQNGEAGRKRFDEIRFASEVSETGESTAAIAFNDDVRLGDEWHRYCCRQHVTVGHFGKIELIRHEEIPGQRESLTRFELRHSGKNH